MVNPGKDLVVEQKFLHQILLSCGVATLLGTMAVGCSSSPTQKPYDAVVVDKSDPHHTVVEFDGSCADGVTQGKYDVKGRKQYSLSVGPKTYYFSSVAARDHFMKDYEDNSKKADQMWAMRDTGSPGPTAIR
jgi:hypothetical protein